MARCNHDYAQTDTKVVAGRTYAVYECRYCPDSYTVLVSEE